MANFRDRLSRAFPVFSDMLKRSKSIIGQTTASGAAAGDVTVTGIKPDDELVAVINLADAADLTDEFTITADDTINNAGGTSTATDNLLVTWIKYAE